MTLELSFPQPETIEKIHALKSVNEQPTKLKGKTARQIAERAVRELGGTLSVDVSKAPEEEIAPIREAANIIVDGTKPVINIYGDPRSSSPEDSPGEDEILRSINAEILDEKSPVNIGRTAFQRFIETLFTNPQNHPLVHREWNEFIVNHATTKKVHSPLETHHFANVGLKRVSEGEDPQRDQVVKFVKEVMQTVRSQVAQVFANPEIEKHANEEMNSPDNQALSIGMAMYSNFVRGGAYYRHRRGENSLAEYEPRKIAAETIDQVTKEFAS